MLGFVAIDGVYQPFARAEPDADLDLGRVRIGEPRRLTGRLQDHDGTPLANARIAALPQSRLRDEACWITYADHGGRFTFAALPAGQLDVFAEASVHGLVSAVVKPDATSTVLQITFTGTVEGVVQDFEGNPMAGAWVTLTRSGGIDDSFAPGPSPQMTTVAGHCDAEGHFLFRGLPAGEWQLLGNSVRNGVFHGGGSQFSTGATDLRVILRSGRG
ncbi:MAG: carboxypeptidase-like regulatory domain-containing protein [Planctomycetota bacterium]